ncbi:MAG TPA: nuclear transport factor 2 family protein [Steroidobacteraceae bacterium]|nr:nuclear transport factor 2 family protein [Steroidobacteraceae bacterium]
MRKEISLAAACAAIALSVVPAFAQPPGSERTAAAVMAVEHEWLAALKRHDVTTLARILGREFIDSDFQGDAITRAQYLAYFAHPVAHPAAALRQTFADTKVRFVAGGNVAIVTGVVITQPAAAAKGTTSSSAGGVRHSRFTDVFVWRDARWQAVTGQETHFTSATG